MLEAELALNLESRGSRRLRWYGANWEGTGELHQAPPLPARAQAIVDRVCERAGFPEVNVATLHVYHRSSAKAATEDHLGPTLAGRQMAIVPHTDDPLLTGAGGVLMLQVAGDAEVAICHRAKRSAKPKCLGLADRGLGHVVVCEGEVWCVRTVPIFPCRRFKHRFSTPCSGRKIRR